MYYLKIDTDNMLNGDGLRIVFWVAGCGHKCKGCQNQHTWNPKQGTLYTEATRDLLVSLLSQEHIAGITFTGGDPLYYTNIDEITELSKYLRKVLPNKTQWLYSGDLWEDIRTKEIVKTIDVLVDGPFKIGEKDNTLLWKGSANQRVIDVQASLKKRGKPILHCPDHKETSLLKDTDYTHRD